ncbi:hypothetical protein [Mesomycoplasma dispar]|uniref:Uncharacterized protein n=1 Tax=Mesomycoplasma dispar TaxID=86660 RepID=A0ABN5DRV9_9BACT|nr:hypothetical protein [Mesomycoplasma dispar]ATP59754.1 hypothetical protein CSW10_02300 [Mesomycoplasma dispar]
MIKFILKVRNEKNSKKKSPFELEAQKLVSKYANYKKSKKKIFITKAGQIDYKKMEKALSNLVTFSISYNKNRNVRRVYVGSEFKIKKGEKFKASLAWAFNAGIIEGWKKLAKESNWLGNIFAIVLTKALWEYAANEYEQKLLKEGTNKNDNKFEHEWLKKKELFEKQENLLFTDYDLILEKKIDGNRWEEVDSNSGRSSRSNVELVRYKPNSDGVYRLVIKKYKSSLFEESIDDDLAVSYVIS